MNTVDTSKEVSLEDFNVIANYIAQNATETHALEMQDRAYIIVSKADNLPAKNASFVHIMQAHEDGSTITEEIHTINNETDPAYDINNIDLLAYRDVDENLKVKSFPSLDIVTFPEKPSLEGKTHQECRDIIKLAWDEACRQDNNEGKYALEVFSTRKEKLIYNVQRTAKKIQTAQENEALFERQLSVFDKLPR